jgi:hypothetical protein
MKPKDFRDEYRRYKDYIKEFSKKMMLSRMVFDNLSDLIKNGWNMMPYSGYSGIRIVPCEGITIAVDDFDKFVAKMAKIFRKEPYMNVEENSINATFYIYPNMNDDTNNWPHVMIDIRTDNTETCDVTYEEYTAKRAIVTGYCKALQEKKYLIHQS